MIKQKNNNDYISILDKKKQHKKDTFLYKIKSFFSYFKKNKTVEEKKTFPIQIAVSDEDQSIFQLEREKKEQINFNFNFLLFGEKDRHRNIKKSGSFYKVFRNIVRICFCILMINISLINHSNPATKNKYPLLIDMINRSICFCVSMNIFYMHFSSQKNGVVESLFFDVVDFLCNFYFVIFLLKLHDIEMGRLIEVQVKIILNCLWILFNEVSSSDIVIENHILTIILLLKILNLIQIFFLTVRSLEIIVIFVPLINFLDNFLYPDVDIFPFTIPETRFSALDNDFFNYVKIGMKGNLVYIFMMFFIYIKYKKSLLLSGKTVFIFSLSLFDRGFEILFSLCSHKKQDINGLLEKFNYSVFFILILFMFFVPFYGRFSFDFKLFAWFDIYINSMLFCLPNFFSNSETFLQAGKTVTRFMYLIYVIYFAMYFFYVSISDNFVYVPQKFSCTCILEGIIKAIIFSIYTFFDIIIKYNIFPSAFGKFDSVEKKKLSSLSMKISRIQMPIFVFSFFTMFCLLI